MNSSLNFNRQGPCNLALYFIYYSKNCKTEEIEEFADLLKASFMNLTHIKPKGKKEFCGLLLEKNKINTPLTPAQIVSTKFFQNLQSPKPLSVSHTKVLEIIVPCVLQTVQKEIYSLHGERAQDLQVSEWTARFLENYLSEERIKKQEAVQDKVDAKVCKKRQNLEKELHQAVSNKFLSEKDLDSLIEVSQLLLNHLRTADDLALLLNLTGHYLQLCAQHMKKPVQLYKELQFIREVQARLTENDFIRFMDLSRLTADHLEKTDHVILTANFMSRYLMLFSEHKKEQALLGEDVLSMLISIFKPKLFAKTD